MIFIAIYTDIGVDSLNREGLDDQMDEISIFAGGVIALTIYLAAAFILKFSSLTAFFNLILKK